MGQNTEELTSTYPSAPAEGTTPEQIATTRANLSRDIDELADKVTPARIVERRKEAARGRLGSVRDRVMGAVPHSDTSVRDRVSGSASSATSSVADTAHGAVGTIESRTEGNPLAAGLVAFGAGMLLSALIPASEKEAQVAQRTVEAAKEHGQPLVDEAKSVGQDIGSNLKESATDRAEQVKASAQESVDTVKSEGQSSAQTVKDTSTPS